MTFPMMFSSSVMRQILGRLHFSVHYWNLIFQLAGQYPPWALGIILTKQYLTIYFSVQDVLKKSWSWRRLCWPKMEGLERWCRQPWRKGLMLKKNSSNFCYITFQHSTRNTSLWQVNAMVKQLSRSRGEILSTIPKLLILSRILNTMHVVNLLQVGQALASCEVSSVLSVARAYVDPWDRLNNFCIHIYAQKWHICQVSSVKCLCWSFCHAYQLLFSSLEP